MFTKFKQWRKRKHEEFLKRNTCSRHGRLRDEFGCQECWYEAIEQEQISNRAQEICHQKELAMEMVNLLLKDPEFVDQLQWKIALAPGMQGEDKL